MGPLTDADIALLPQIRHDQITMSNLLGSGAFGEVYEGCVFDVSSEVETRVAIKTLRKGATEQEKCEFLKEAQLMSNFKHEHILRLIGVCFDMDALYIIMELMQGGDLLSYLRQSRPSRVSIVQSETFHQRKEHLEHRIIFRILLYFTENDVTINTPRFGVNVCGHCVRLPVSGGDAFRAS